MLCTFFAFDVIRSPFFLVDLRAVGTNDAQLDDNKWVFAETQVLLYHFQSDFIWK